MRISIRHDSGYVIEFSQLVVSGREAASGYAVHFTMRGSRHAFEIPITVFDINLTLSLTNPIRPISIFVPSSTQVVQCRNYQNTDEQIHFEAIFTKEQVNALEEHRRDGDLVLNIGLRALVSSNTGLLSSFDSVDVVIPREHWLNALKNAGFRQTLLIEIPLPDALDSPMDNFAKAQEFIEMGHYKDAVMQCRHIIEKIEILRNDKKLAIDASKKIANRQDRETMTAEERMLCLREHLKNVCHLGAHGSENFTRSQAKAVLGMTMALLAEPTVGFAEKLGDGSEL